MWWCGGTDAVCVCVCDVIQRDRDGGGQETGKGGRVKARVRLKKNSGIEAGLLPFTYLKKTVVTFLSSLPTPLLLAVRPPHSPPLKRAQRGEQPGAARLRGGRRRGGECACVGGYTFPPRLCAPVLHFPTPPKPHPTELCCVRRALLAVRGEVGEGKNS